MMVVDVAPAGGTGFFPNRRQLLQSTTALIAAGAASRSTSAQPVASQPLDKAARPRAGLERTKLIGFMLGHEQFTVPELVKFGEAAARAGFGLLATSDHLQPWQANEGHCGQAWVTLGAVGAGAQSAWIGPTVTCPTLRYNPAVV